MSSKNKLGVYYDRLYKTRGDDMLAATDPRDGVVHVGSPVYYTTQIKWTSTITNKMLLDVGWGSQRQRHRPEHAGRRREGARDGRIGTRGGARPTATPGIDMGGDHQHPDLRAGEVATSRRRPSYVTGSHAASSACSSGTGWFEQRQDANADLQQDYRTCVPDSVVVRNTPFRTRDTMNRDLALYVAGHLDHQAPDA